MKATLTLDSEASTTAFGIKFPFGVAVSIDTLTPDQRKKLQGHPSFEVDGRISASATDTVKNKASAPENEVSAADAELLAELRATYEQLLGKKPSHFMRVPGLKTAIDEALAAQAAAAQDKKEA